MSTVSGIIISSSGSSSSSSATPAAKAVTEEEGVAFFAEESVAEGDVPTAGPIEGSPRATTTEAAVVIEQDDEEEEDYDAMGRDAMAALEQALLERHLNNDTNNNSANDTAPVQTPLASATKARVQKEQRVPSPPSYYAAFFDPHLGAYGGGGAFGGAFGSAFGAYGGGGGAASAYGGGGGGGSSSSERWIEHEIINPLRQLLHDTRDAQRRTEFLFTENNLLRRRHAERQQLIAEVTGQQHAAWSGALELIARQQRQLLEQQHSLLRALKAFAVSSDAPAAPSAAPAAERPPAPPFLSRAADPFHFDI